MAAELKDEEVVSDIKKSNQDYGTKCNAHVEQDIALFCLTCEEGICLICIPQNKHRLHDLCQIQEVADIMQKEFQELLQKEGAEKLRHEIEKRSKEIDSKKKAILSRQEKLKTDIRSRAENLGKCIEETKQRLSLCSDHAFAEQLKLLNDQEFQGSKCLALLKKYHDDPDSFSKEHKNDMPHVVKYLRGLQITDRTAADCLPTLQGDLEMTEEHMQKIPGALTDLGRKSNSDQCTAVETDRAVVKCLPTLLYDPEMTKEYVQRIFGVLTDPVKTSKSDLSTATHSRLVKEFKVGTNFCIKKISPVDSKKVYVLANEVLYKVEFSPEHDTHSIVSGVQDITDVSDKGVYLCTKTHITLCTFDDKLYHLDKVANSRTQFRSICINTDGNVAYYSDEEGKPEADFHSDSDSDYGELRKISSASRQHIISQSGIKVQPFQFGTTQSSMGINKAASFTFCSVEERKPIAACHSDLGSDCEDHRKSSSVSRLHIIRQNGVKVKTVKLGTLHRYGSLYRLADNHDNIYFLERCSDSGLVVKADKVKYDKTNFYEGNIGSNPAQLFDPRGICFDAKGKIIIADYRNHAIHLLDNDGRFLKFLLRQWEGLKHPTAVAVDKLGFLWIGQQDGTIQIRSYEL